MITYEDAQTTLSELILSGILSEEIVDNLQEISTCIEYLERGYNLFGGEDNEVCELFTAKRNPYNSSAPYNTDELKKEYDAWIEKVDRIAEKYSIIRERC